VEGMGFEELLHKVGGFGPFQLRNLVLLALPRFLLPMHFLLPIFMAAVPAHHCALPDAPANLSHQDLWLKTHLPRETDGSFSSCLRFAYPQALPNVTLGTEVYNSGEPEGEPLTVPCSQGWEYDRSEFSSTIATEVPKPRGCGICEWVEPAITLGAGDRREPSCTLRTFIPVWRPACSFKAGFSSFTIIYPRAKAAPGSWNRG
jgi:hypothetical protein